MADDKYFWLWVVLASAILGLFLRECDDRVPDLNCVEEVTPWGVECA